MNNLSAPISLSLIGCPTIFSNFLAFYTSIFPLDFAFLFAVKTHCLYHIHSCPFCHSLQSFPKWIFLSTCFLSQLWCCSVSLQLAPMESAGSVSGIFFFKIFFSLFKFRNLPILAAVWVNLFTV